MTAPQSKKRTKRTPLANRVDGRRRWSLWHQDDKEVRLRRGADWAWNSARWPVYGLEDWAKAVPEACKWSRKVRWKKMKLSHNNEFLWMEIHNCKHDSSNQASISVPQCIGFSTLTVPQSNELLWVVVWVTFYTAVQDLKYENPQTDNDGGRSVRKMENRIKITDYRIKDFFVSQVVESGQASCVSHDIPRNMSPAKGIPLCAEGMGSHAPML